MDYERMVLTLWNWLATGRATTPVHHRRFVSANIQVRLDILKESTWYAA